MLSLISEFMEALFNFVVNRVVFSPYVCCGKRVYNRINVVTVSRHGILLGGWNIPNFILTTNGVNDHLFVH